MNHYRTSIGDRVSKATIDRNVRLAKRKRLQLQIDYFEFNFCEQCKRSSDVYLDCAHIESVDSCQKTHCSEKAWDTKNINVLCRECHQKHDKLQLKWDKKNRPF